MLYQEESVPRRLGLDESKIKGAEEINQINSEMNDKLDVSYSGSNSNAGAQFVHPAHGHLQLGTVLHSIQAEDV